MNLTLLKMTAKNNLIIMLIILALMAMYLVIIIPMFDPESIEAIEGMIELLPKELVSMMGFDETAIELTGFIGSFYYSFIVILFPTIFTIIVSNRLIARHVDRGSMAYLLSTPNSRKTVAFTQAFYLLGSITILFAIITVTGLLMSESLFPGHLNHTSFLHFNLISMVIFWAVAGICFLFSCIFNESKYSFGFGGGIAILMFVLNMISNLNEQYTWLSNATIFSFLDWAKIIEGGSFIVTATLVPIVIAAVTFTLGVFVFDKRSIPI